MGRKKKNKKSEPVKDIQKVKDDYKKEVEENKELSLLVDPDNKYNFTEQEKKFIEYYIRSKNVNLSAKMCGMEHDEGLMFLLSFNAQTEIRRINLAICHHQFQTKIATLDEIGGYLTSLLTGEYIPLSEQLTNKSKVEVAKLIIDINKLQQGAIDNPSVILTKNIDIDLKNLSVKTIKNMLQNSPDDDNLTIEGMTLTPEEIASVKSQNKEYKELLNLINKGGKDE